MTDPETSGAATPIAEAVRDPFIEWMIAIDGAIGTAMPIKGAGAIAVADPQVGWMVAIEGTMDVWNTRVIFLNTLSS